MYRHLYGLTEKPFQISTDPTFLWLGGKHREALAVLVYGVRDSKGFLLLLGGVGTGKTTLIRALLDQLDKNVVVATVKDPGLSPMEFFNFIAAAYGMRRRYTNKVDFLFDFEKFLRKTRAAGRNALLIVDEAQRLDQRLLEEIRLLSNIEDPDQKLLNVFFVGQEEFLDIIAALENRALKQRITINYHLETLSPEETEQLVRHRLKVAGAAREIFTPDAFPLIHRFSQGAPRLINILCDHALLTGFVKDADTIGADIIAESIEDLMLPGEHPRHLPPLPPEGVETSRPVAATVTAGIMLQNRPPSRRRVRWPWAAAAGLLLAVGVGIVMEHNWPPFGALEIPARQAPANAETPVRPEKAPESRTDAPSIKAEAVEQAETGSTLPAVTPDALPSKVAGPDSAGSPGKEKTLFAARPTRPPDMESTAHEDAAPSRPKAIGFGLPEDDLAPPPLIGHEIPDPLPPPGAINGKAPVGNTETAAKRPAPPPKRIAKAPGSAETDKIRPPAAASRPADDLRPSLLPSAISAAVAPAPPASPLGPLANPAPNGAAALPTPTAVEGLRTQLPASSAATTYSTGDRLRDFINAYAQAYESLDLNRFRLFFTQDAVENGRPFSTVLPTYRKNFAALAGLIYRIDLMSWERDDTTGRITLSGVFNVRYSLQDRDWRTTRGQITMDLVSNGGLYRVKRLEYSKGRD